MNDRTRAILAVSGALTLVVGVFLVAAPAGASVSTQRQTAQDQLANCQLLAADRGATSTQRTWARDCVSAQQRIIRLLTGVAPTPTQVPPSPTPGSTPTVAPSTPAPTTTTPPTLPPTLSPTPTTPSSGWPGADNTGVPSGVTLTPWTGSCTITAANIVIEARLFSCNVSIRAIGVVIRESRISGWIDNTDQQGTSFTLVDSEVALPGVVQLTAVGNHDFTLLRVEVTGGNRGVYCQKTCDIRDSWIHGTRIQADWHASAVRMEQGLTLVHNTLVCDAPVQSNPEGSCSASLTGYGDYAPVRDNLIQGNFFGATQYAAYCAYGGSSKGKPFSDQAANIRFIDNVFERGTSSTNRSCALYGAVGDWDPTKPGAVFTGNRYSDGTVVPNVQT